MYHISVLKEEAIEGLNIKKDGIYVDGTTGGGGHSYEIASRLDEGRLVCIDKDIQALEESKNKLKEHIQKIDFVHDSFININAILKERKIEAVDGILLDLGVSSHQLDEESRGFSYMKPEAPLDMRMDTEGTIRAEDIINSYDEEDLIRIFKEYGEEKFSRKIAQAIVNERKSNHIQTTGQLNEIIQKCVPKVSGGGHPSKRVFQALRIEVNDEIAPLSNCITNMIDCLNNKGRICVITFHSLEDRIVKNAFKEAQDPCICPKNFPQCVCGRVSKGKVITRKPIAPKAEEINNNSRSKSAKLRIFERQMTNA